MEVGTQQRVLQTKSGGLRLQYFSLCVLTGRESNVCHVFNYCTCKEKWRRLTTLRQIP